jgi:hypothetical protein
MARLDRAIHERDKNLRNLLDGRVKPGHDSRVCRRRQDYFRRPVAGAALRTEYQTP